MVFMRSWQSAKQNTCSPLFSQVFWQLLLVKYSIVSQQRKLDSLKLDSSILFYLKGNQLEHMNSVNEVTQVRVKLIWKTKKVRIHTSSVTSTCPQTKVHWTTVTALGKLSRYKNPLYVLYNTVIQSAFYEVSDSQSTQNQCIMEVKRIKWWKWTSKWLHDTQGHWLAASESHKHRKC